MYKCPKCSWQGTLTVLPKHFKTHNQGLLECKYCFVELVSANEREKHEKKHLDKKGNVHYNCYLCPAKSENHEMYAEHFERNHNTSQQHSCKYCPRKFTSLGNLARHILSAHKENVATVENDQLIQLERITIELHGFEKELVTCVERDKKGRLAFRCPKCENKFYGVHNMKYHYDYYADYKSGKSCTANRHKPQIKKERKEHLEEECSDSEAESDVQSEINESGAEIDDSLKELINQPMWVTSTSLHDIVILSEQEKTSLPLVVAVNQQKERKDSKSCFIVWCTKLGSDLASLLILKQNISLFCVMGNEHLEIPQSISQYYQGLVVGGSDKL